MFQDSDQEQEEEGARGGFEKQNGDWGAEKGESKGEHSCHPKGQSGQQIKEVQKKCEYSCNQFKANRQSQQQKGKAKGWRNNDE